jgi:periplasmic copper chaperone A
MYKLYRFCGLLTALLLSANIYAGDIEIEGAWIRATAPGQEMAMMDLSIISKQPAILLGISSTVSRTVEMHSMTQENGMMKMREVKEIEIPAGRRFNLGESGYHLMLDGLKAPLKEGETVPVTLSIKAGKQGTVKIETKAEVRSLTATKPSSDDEDHHMHMQMK